MDVAAQLKAYERVQNALAELKAGKMIVLVDDEDRENEGDLVMAAEHVTPADVNFMATHGRGLICLSLTEEQVEHLRLPMMAPRNTSAHGTGFTISIEAAAGVTTGISAADRAHTIRVACDPQSKASDLVMPGHIFPLRAKKGGVLVRAGHTEGSVDLARLAGLKPAAVICEILNEDGSMARQADLQAFAATHGLVIVSIADLIQYRTRHESLVRVAAESRLPTDFGTFKVRVYENDVDDHLHIALIAGELNDNEPTLVRVHSECLTGDIFGSGRCDCGPQLHAALRAISAAGRGVLLYIRQEGRGIGLVNKIRAYDLQDQGQDTVTANESLGFKADLRNYGIGAQVLAHLGLKKLRLLTNNPKKIIGLEGYGLEIVERVAIEVEPGDHNTAYLQAKKQKMGHLLKKI